MKAIGVFIILAFFATTGFSNNYTYSDNSITQATKTETKSIDPKIKSEAIDGVFNNFLEEFIEETDTELNVEPWMVDTPKPLIIEKEVEEPLKIEQWMINSEFINQVEKDELDFVE